MREQRQLTARLVNARLCRGRWQRQPGEQAPGRGAPHGLALANLLALLAAQLIRAAPERGEMMAESIHPVDKHVGERSRYLRVKAGLSQQTVARGLGLTFQQVQKYEKGSNRISASKLFELSRILGCAVQDFFSGLDGAEESAGLIEPHSRLDYEILSILGRLQNDQFKRNVRALLSSVLEASPKEPRASATL